MTRQRATGEKRLQALLKEVRACRICEEVLPHEPRPVLRASASARILIVGQAPGRRVHESGIPWNDPSGDRLRAWMDVSRDVFYDEKRIAIIPMGFCFPGTNPRGGDYPPRPECAAHWHARLFERLPHIELTLLCGQYAQGYFLDGKAGPSLTETVREWRAFGPEYIPTPHPSPRNIAWFKRNAWFEAEVVPEIRRRVHALL